jgi:sterol 3beta-glucosyltransferase
MKIMLMSVGTRGDMEPFLALGEILREKGEQVICAFPEEFRELAEDSCLEFASLGIRYSELLNSDVAKVAMGGSGSGLKKFLANIRLAQNQTDMNKELLIRQQEIVQSENPDRILYNGKAIYPIIWGLENNGRNILICPLPYMHYVRNHTHVAFHRNYSPFLNRLTYSLADFGLAMTVGISAKWLNIERKFTRKHVKTALRTNQAIYTISPSLFTRPDTWGNNLSVQGYHERKYTREWQPDKKLNIFLERHKSDRILFVTFGSMLNSEPEEKTKILLDIFKRNKIPAIINTAAGGLVRPSSYDADLFYFVPQLPYEWIFPKVYGVVHHGGAGTTHAAIKNGCASLIIPHIIDQFAWDAIVADLGVGPKGIRVGKITQKSLEPKILALLYNRSYKQKAEEVALRMEKEVLREEVYRAITGV